MANEENEQKPTLNDVPIFYTYRDKNGWVKTDRALTHELNRAFVIRKDFKFKNCGYSFYPQWREPEDKTERKVAWRITSDNAVVARWEWCEVEHKKSHKTCQLLGNGMCRRQKLLYLKYDKERKLWVRENS